MSDPALRPGYKAYALGLLGVVIFALTFPMTRLAMGHVDQPQLSPWFVAIGRAALAGLLSILYLVLTHKPTHLFPKGDDWVKLAITSACIVFGFPLLTTLALCEVESIHAAVISGIIPLSTAAVGAVMARHYPGLRFWFWAIAGASLVVGFALFRSGQRFALHTADLLLLSAMVLVAFGYAVGAKLSRKLGAERVICWILVISLPISIPTALFTAPAQTVSWTTWLGFAYVSIFSMWLGFFAWYKALAIGGTVKVSQIQLVQPFLSMLFSVPILGERLDLLTLVFACAVLFTVWMGKKSA